MQARITSRACIAVSLICGLLTWMAHQVTLVVVPLPMPSSLLTAEQQARLDAAVAEAALSRSPGNGTLLGRSPEKGVCKVGRPHSKTSKQPGAATGEGAATCYVSRPAC